MVKLYIPGQSANSIVFDGNTAPLENEQFCDMYAMQLAQTLFENCPGPVLLKAVAAMQSNLHDKPEYKKELEKLGLIEVNQPGEETPEEHTLNPAPDMEMMTDQPATDYSNIAPVPPEAVPFEPEQTEE